MEKKNRFSNYNGDAYTLNIAVVVSSPNEEYQNKIAFVVTNTVKKIFN